MAPQIIVQLYTNIVPKIIAMIYDTGLKYASLYQPLIRKRNKHIQTIAIRMPQKRLPIEYAKIFSIIKHCLISVYAS